MISKEGNTVAIQEAPFETHSASLHALPTRTTCAAMQLPMPSLKVNGTLTVSKRECGDMKHLDGMKALTDETG